MSGVGGKAEVFRETAEVRKVPTADIGFSITLLTIARNRPR